MWILKMLEILEKWSLSGKKKIVVLCLAKKIAIKSRGLTKSAFSIEEKPGFENLCLFLSSPNFRQQ